VPETATLLGIDVEFMYALMYAISKVPTWLVEEL